MSDYPRKPIEVQITANGFTWAEVIAALQERIDRLNEHHELGVGVSASGHGASHTAQVQLRDVTQEQFIEESCAWHDEQQRQRRESSVD